MKSHAIFSIVATVILIGLCSAFANAPRLLNYQGRLTDLAGTPLTGTYSMQFKIYDAATGGNVGWTETHPTVAVNGGLFEVLLGSVGQLYDTTFADSSRWVGLQVGAEPELSPRTRLATSAYSFRTASVDGATGGTISGNTSIQSDLTVSGNVGIGTSPGFSRATIDNSDAGNSTDVLALKNGAPTTLNSGARLVFLANSDAGMSRVADVEGVITDVSGNFDGALLFYTALDGGRNERMRITGTGEVGIGTSTPTAALDVVGDLKVSGNIETGGNIIGSTPWTAFPFAAGYNNYQDAHGGGWQTAQYRKIGDIVYLRGMIHKADHAVIPNAVSIGTLPVGFRPSGHLRLSSAEPASSVFQIHSTGDIFAYFLAGSLEYQFLDGISFSTTP